MATRIYPLLPVKLKPVKSETLTYSKGTLRMSEIPLKCLKNIENRFKVYVDYKFKGNSRYPNEQSDYYVVDLEEIDTIFLPSHQDYGSIVAVLEEQVEKERHVTDFVSDAKVMVLTMSHLVHDGWLFTQEANGEVVAFQPDYGEKKRFSDDEKLKRWVLAKALEY